MRSLALLLCLLLGAVALADPPSVKLPAEVKGLPGAWIVIPATVEGGKPRWRLLDGIEEVPLDVIFPPDVLTQAKGKVVKADRPGRYRVESWNAAGDVASDIAVCIVVVGDVPPTPPGPTPPGPNPPPVPIPTDGFRVLFIEETGKRSELTTKQLAVLNSTRIREYLIRKCPKGPDGKTPEYRFIDQDENFAKESETWQKILAATKPQVKDLPAMVVINGTAGEVLPIPKDATEDTILAALKQRGGE